ncbi:unnamed protein product [Effrenium voratum]|nr:unnamed protein product [Effrenium voratum]
MLPRGDALSAWATAAQQLLPGLRVAALPKGEGALVLLGAEHDVEQAALQVETAIDCLRPDHVGLELCQKRFRRLFPLGLAAFAQLPPEERLQLQAKLRSGKDQLSAAAAAHRLGIPVALCDREVRVTEARLLARLAPGDLVAGSLAALGLNWDCPEALEDAVADCIIRERDKVLARRLSTLPGLALGVLGVRHLEGVLEHVGKDLDPDVDAMCTAATWLQERGAAAALAPLGGAAAALAPPGHASVLEGS